VPTSSSSTPNDLALVLGGGGARAAYQAGVLRGLGTRETESPDALSLIMFQPDYTRRLMDLGEADAEARCEEINAFLARSSHRVS
jgi:predicted acylesterase/phospholipase RssA